MSERFIKASVEPLLDSKGVKVGEKIVNVFESLNDQGQVTGYVARSGKTAAILAVAGSLAKVAEDAGIKLASVEAAKAAEAAKAVKVA